MPVKKLDDKNIRKLTRTGRAGSSLDLTIPKEMVSELGWQERRRITVKINRKKLLISDWKK